MNKDLYIVLLEEHVDDLTTAAKIDTVLSFQKTEKIRELKSELVSMNDWNKAQDELISKIADTAMDYKEAAIVYPVSTQVADLEAENKKLKEIIFILKKEAYETGKKLFDLEKQGVGDSESLQLFRAMEAAE